MRGFVLALVFLAPGLHAWSRLNPGTPILDQLPYKDLLLCLPALLWAIPSLVVSPRFTHALFYWGMAGLLLAFLSLMWTEPRELGRGILICAGLSCPIPISRLINSHRLQRWCAMVFIVGSALHLIAILRISQGYFGRLGQYSSGGVNSNANDFGSEMALAVLVLWVYITNFKSSDAAETPRSEKALRLASFVGMGIFGIALLGSASRGSILALIGGLCSAWLIQRVTTGRILLALTGICACFCALMLDLPIISPVVERFVERGNLTTAGDRWWIWEGGFMALIDHWQRGVGIGSVDLTLGHYALIHEGSVQGLDGTVRVFTHNTFLEWAMATGVPGILVAGIGTIGVVLTSLKLDLSQSTIHRVAMLGFIMMMAMSTTVYRLSYFIPLASLFLASLQVPAGNQFSGIAPVARQKLSSQRKSQSTAAGNMTSLHMPPGKAGQQPKMTPGRSWKAPAFPVKSG